MVQVVTAPNQQTPPVPSRVSLSKIVELVGPAGVGKSTLTKALCDHCACAREGLEPDRLASVASFSAQMTRLVPAYLGNCLGSHWLSRNEMRCIYLLGAWSLRANAPSDSSPRLSVMDHGPIFRLTYLKVFGSRLSKTRRFQCWWEQMLSSWSQKLTRIVCLEADNDELIERVRSRQGRSDRFRSRSDSAARAFLEDYRRGYDEVLNSIARLGGPDVLSFNTQRQSPDEIATEVLGNLDILKDRELADSSQPRDARQGR